MVCNTNCTHTSATACARSCSADRCQSRDRAAGLTSPCGAKNMAAEVARQAVRPLLHGLPTELVTYLSDAGYDVGAFVGKGAWCDEMCCRAGSCPHARQQAPSTPRSTPGPRHAATSHTAAVRRAAVFTR